MPEKIFSFMVIMKSCGKDACVNMMLYGGEVSCLQAKYHVIGVFSMWQAQGQYQ